MTKHADQGNILILRRKGADPNDSSKAKDGELSLLVLGIGDTGEYKAWLEFLKKRIKHHMTLVE